MNDADLESEDLVSIGLYPSCTAVHDALLEQYEDTESQLHYWCWQTTQGDWNQIGTMIFFGLAINLGIYLLTYGAITANLSKIAGIAVSRHPQSMYGNNTLEPLWRRSSNNNSHLAGNPDAHRKPNIAMLIILMLLIVNTALYFAIKVFIVSHPRAHYINTTVDQFDEMSFYEFYNTREIILLSIFAVNTMFFRRHSAWFQIEGTWLESLAAFARYLSYVDIIFTFVIFCIYYPLLLLWLYHMAISFLVICPLMAILIICVIVPCALCCVVPCAELCMSRFVRMEQTAEAFTCRCRNSCVRFLFAVLLVIVELAVYVTVLATVLSMAFFIVDGMDGPPQVVFYMDYNSDADGTIFYLYMSTVIVGGLGLMTGVFALMTSSGDDDEHRRSPRPGTEVPMEELSILSNEDSE